MYFTRNPIKRVFKNAGAKRVTLDAIDELRKHLEKETMRILEEAKRLAEHKKKKTVTKKDIKYVIRCLRR